MIKDKSIHITFSKHVDTGCIVINLQLLVILPLSHYFRSICSKTPHKKWINETKMVERGEYYNITTKHKTCTDANEVRPTLRLVAFSPAIIY